MLFNVKKTKVEYDNTFGEDDGGFDLSVTGDYNKGESTANLKLKRSYPAAWTTFHQVSLQVLRDHGNETVLRTGLDYRRKLYEAASCSILARLDWRRNSLRLSTDTARDINGGSSGKVSWDSEGWTAEAMQGEAKYTHEKLSLIHI